MEGFNVRLRYGCDSTPSYRGPYLVNNLTLVVGEPIPALPSHDGYPVLRDVIFEPLGEKGCHATARYGLNVFKPMSTEEVFVARLCPKHLEVTVSDIGKDDGSALHFGVSLLNESAGLECEYEPCPGCGRNVDHDEDECPGRAEGAWMCSFGHMFAYAPPPAYPPWCPAEDQRQGQPVKGCTGGNFRWITKDEVTERDWPIHEVSFLPIWKCEDGVKVIDLAMNDYVAVLTSMGDKVAFNGIVTGVEQGRVKVLPDDPDIDERWRPAQIIRRAVRPVSEDATKQEAEDRILGRHMSAIMDRRYPKDDFDQYHDSL